MTGFEAISHYNGWAMALVGASIVISGLTILSLIISQLHKVVGLLEKRPEDIPDSSNSPEVEEDFYPTNIDATANLYRPLTEELGEQFNLADLYSLANKYHLPHPHLSIRCLRDAGKLEALGDGVFRFTA